MRAIVASLVLALNWTACGGTDFTSAEGSGGHASIGAGGSHYDGRQTGRGGTEAATSTADSTADATCAAAWNEYAKALPAARVCEGPQNCKADWALPGDCACDVLVNAEAEAYASAKSLYDAFIAAGCEIPVCTTPCPTHPAGQTTPTCREGGAGITETKKTTCEW